MKEIIYSYELSPKSSTRQMVSSINSSEPENKKKLNHVVNNAFNLLFGSSGSGREYVVGVGAVGALSVVLDLLEYEQPMIEANTNFKQLMNEFKKYK